MSYKNIFTILAICVLIALFSISCDRVVDPSESITIDTTGREGAGITVSPITGLVTSENHDTAQFTVVLASQPTADVTVPVRTMAMKEGVITVGTNYREQVMLTFTDADWNTPQTVTVTGVDETDLDGEPVQDGDVQYVISLEEAISEDENYNGINPSNVLVTNADNDFPGIIVLSDTNLLYTNENQQSIGQVTSIIFKLRMRPNGNITIGPITSTDTTEGQILYLSDPYTITINSSSWNMTNSISVQGQPDHDGDTVAQNYQIDFGTITASSPLDDAWDGLDAGSVDMLNQEYNPISNYAYNSTSGTFSSIAGNSEAEKVAFETYDYYGTEPSGYIPEQNGYALIDIGFDFQYLGMVFSSIVVTTDGMASFSPTIFSYSYYSDNYSLFSSYGIRCVLAPWWDDLDTTSGGVYYLTSTAPNRTFTVEWSNVISQNDWTETYNFQLVLHEGTNEIQFIYGNKLNGPSTTYSSSASMGISDDYYGYIDASGYSGNYYLTYDNFPDAGTIINIYMP